MTGTFNYGNRLRDLRTSCGLTQEEMAFRADITTSYYGQLERGQANPSVGMLEKICAVMGITIADIFTETDTNILGIDPISMQILHQLSNKTNHEKEIILSLIKTAFKLKNSGKSEKGIDKHKKV